jgi:urease accessory protein UreF
MGRRLKSPVRTLTGPPLKSSVIRRRDEDEQRLHAELGKLVRSWANLHEFLASILAKTLECNKAIAFGMWHSIKSDLAQREMLAAALKTKIRLLANEGEKAKRLGKPEISTQKYDDGLHPVPKTPS